MAMWKLALLCLCLIAKSSAETDGRPFAASPHTNILLIILGAAFLVSLVVVVLVFWFARKRAPVEEQNQAAALESGFHDRVKEGGGGNWLPPPPPPPSAPPLEPSEEFGRGRVRKDVYGEIVEEEDDVVMTRR